MQQSYAIQNIANKKREVFLFLRDEKGRQEIKSFNDFFPFFYEPDSKGKYIGYDGAALKRVFVSEPGDVPHVRSLNSYSADIKFTTNFLMHRVDKIESSSTKYCFLDIEIQANELPTTKEAKFPISCISIYNSVHKNIQTFFLNDFVSEKDLIEAFIVYMQKERFDIWISWNSSFDYDYCYARIKDFARRLSPIDSVRMGENRDIFYPAGLSIIDYLQWFKKIYMREASYALDYIGEKHLSKGKEYKNVDFSIVNEIVRKRNIGDVQMMVDLENKYNIISYYDEIRRMAKVQWEDLVWNSRIVEGFLFQEAKLKNVVLPNKEIRDDAEEITFKGAIRDTEASGLYFDCAKLDLTSAYPSMIINFNLDSTNIVTEDAKNVIDIAGVKFKQNANALLPSIVKKILIIKDRLKKEKKANSDDKFLAIKYDAIKAIVNSFWGVMGSPYFRLFNVIVAETITFLVRDLLTYVKERIEKEGLKVVYFDTDSVVINNKEDVSIKLNQYVRDWAKEKYNKNDIDLKFDYEGYFKSLFILGKCHYMGYLNNKKDPEMKGIEAKRSNSSKYEAKFQRELLDKVLNKENREQILEWISKEKNRVKTLNSKDIGFPAKISSKAYKVETIFGRAYNNARVRFKDFKARKGDLFYYTFVKSLGKDRNSKEIDVIAFDEDTNLNNIIIDYDKVINRSIIQKTEKVFSALNWYLAKNEEQLSLV